MDFSWSAEQEELHRAARDLARGQADGPADFAGGFDRRGWDAYARFGLTGLCVSEAYGGSGLDLLTSARVTEGIGEGTDRLGVVFAACAHLFACCVPLEQYAAPVVKDRWLAELASGQRIGANAITEPEAGSDVYAMRTRAERDEDGYRISGSKLYVTNGPVADVVIVYASTDPSAGFLGLSAFVVERGAPGLEFGPPQGKVGLSGSQISPLFLDGCRVPADHLLGREGQGARVFEASMTAERACLFAMYVGAMQRQLDAAVTFARTRTQFGRPIAKNQAVSHRLVDMAVRLESARALVYRACWLADTGATSATAVSMAKLAVSEAAIASGLDLMRIHGGAGVMSDTGVATGLLDALPGSTFSGTADMQREIIAAGLGL